MIHLWIGSPSKVIPHKDMGLIGSRLRRETDQSRSPKTAVELECITTIDIVSTLHIEGQKLALRLLTDLNIVAHSTLPQAQGEFLIRASNISPLCATGFLVAAARNLHIMGDQSGALVAPWRVGAI